MAEANLHEVIQASILRKAQLQLEISQLQAQKSLAISAQTNPLASLAMKQLSNLANAQAHATVVLPQVDEGVFKKLKIQLTTEAEIYAKKLYVK